MQIVDTIVLVCAINPRSANYEKASHYLDLLGKDEETLVPLVSVIEFDLVMKGRKYTSSQRKDAFEWLAHVTPSAKMTSNSALSIKAAVGLQESGMGYFDSLIAALAIDLDSIVLTKDKEISKVVRTKW